MATAKIIDIRDIPSADPGRVGKMDSMIVYQLDAFRTYTTIMPKEDLTEDRIRERIKAEEGERAEWKAKTFEI